MRTIAVLCAGILVLALQACNDKPTDIGSVLVPGTDTLYGTSSAELPILRTTGSVETQEPIYNATYVLFGNTSDSEARLFVELINYPQLGSPDSFSIVRADLEMVPQVYCLGDTTVTSFAGTAYELQQAWSAQATWDSIWTSDGTSPYYSEAQQPITQFTIGSSVPDSVYHVPLDTTVIRRWLTLGMDSARVDEVFGMVIVPQSTGAIRQFRNLNGTNHVLRLRVITQSPADTLDDTTYVDAAVACFTKSPLPSSEESIVQGARLLRATYEVRLDTLPPLAVLMGSSFRVCVDVKRSTVGTLGLDELLSLRYRSKDGTLLTLLTRGSAEGVYLFPNIVAVLQRIRADGGTGTIEIGPANDNAYGRMNRLWIYPPTEQEPTLVPQMTLIYTVPKELE